VNKQDGKTRMEVNSTMGTLTNRVQWCGLDSPETGFSLWTQLRNFRFHYSNHHLTKETMYSSSVNQLTSVKTCTAMMNCTHETNTYCKQMYSTLHNKIGPIFPTAIQKIRRFTWQNSYQFSSKF